jgi:hypothetical protein
VDFVLDEESMSATSTAIKSRERHCEKHGGQVYFQLYIPHPNPQLCWIGQCRLCAEHEDLERQARAILAERGAELRRRIGERYKPDAEQIEAETDAAVEAAAQRIVDEMEEHRPEFEAEVRRRHHSQAEQEVEAEMLAEIVSELRKGT